MILKTLLEALYHPKPEVRIQALRVLAMVEETRTLETVINVRNTDPDANVQQIAGWVVEVIMAAYQRGHRTEDAISALTKPLQDDYLAERLVDDQVVHPGLKQFGLQADVATLKGEWERLDSISAARKASDTPVSPDHLDLLDAGLSHAFRAYIEGEMP